jgi:carboxyl-terminal processing protease
MEQKRMRKAPIFLAVICAAAIFYAGFSVGEKHRPAIEKVTELSNKEEKITSPDIVNFAPFWEAWNVLNEKYVGNSTTSPQEKVWGAIEGLAASLKDPYTVFMPPEESAAFESEIQGSFEGVGMEIDSRDGVIIVVSPLKGTPAESAGLQPGDKIIKINDTVTTNMRVDNAVKLIRGKSGTVVRLTIIRNGKRAPFEVSVTRGLITIPTIDTELRKAPAKPGEKTATTTPSTGLREDGVFVIKLYNFSSAAPELFRQALRDFIVSRSSRLIIDLRGNPGGFLEVAVDAASFFLPVGEIVAIEDHGGKEGNRMYRSHGYNAFNNNLKMAILVNGGSASASEILAGALREHGKAILVGTKTFGKGSVQELVKITPETSLKVTIARWLTPKGHSISAEGLTPDVVVERTSDDIEKGRDPQMDKAVELLTK